MVFNQSTETFFKGATTELHAHCLRQISFARKHKSYFCEPKMVSLVRATLENFDLHILPCDKDGGMAVTSTSSLLQATHELLNNVNLYRRISIVDCNGFMDVLEDYRMAAVAVSVEKPKLRSALLSGLRQPDPCSKVAAKLQNTVKTHKPSGSVTLRPIHAFSGSPMEPGMKYMNSLLKPGLSKLPHLLRDANDLVSKLRSFKVPHGARWLKLDVKDFYMTGAHPLLVEESSKIVEPSMRADYKCLAESILENQYVVSDMCPQSFYKVVTGTGMGMIPSGCVSDSVLYSLLEKGFILKPHNRQRFSVYFYSRFRDDILLIVGDDTNTNRSLVEHMRSHAFPFSLKVESISREGCQMLDLDIGVSKGLTFDFVFFRLFVKETSIWKPLSPDSSHPRSIHLHWPRAQITRIFSRFSSKKEGEIAVNNFKQLYFGSFGTAIDESHLPRHPVRNTSWIVLPYNLCLISGLARLVSTFVVPFGFAFDKVGLSWKLGGKHLMHLLRRQRVSMQEEE